MDIGNATGAANTNAAQSQEKELEEEFFKFMMEDLLQDEVMEQVEEE